MSVADTAMPPASAPMATFGRRRASQPTMKGHST